MFDGDLPPKNMLVKSPWLVDSPRRIPVFGWSNHVKSWFVDCQKKVWNVHLEMPWPMQFSHRTLRLAALGILKMGQTCFWGGSFCHVSQKNNLFFDVRYLHYTSNNPQHKHRTVLPKLPAISQVTYVGVWKMMQPGPSIATTRKLQNDRLVAFLVARKRISTKKPWVAHLTRWSPSRLAAKPMETHVKGLESPIFNGKRMVDW